MAGFTFFASLLLVFILVKEGNAFNIGIVTMPIFQMLVKDLPQDEANTKDEYIGEGLPEYYSKLKVLDAWKANPNLELETILNDKITTIITDGRTLFERDFLTTAGLPGYNCTRFCYNVSVPMILNVTGWSVERLDGKISPIVKLRDIYNAGVKAIEKRFCCNMTAIAIQLNLDNGVERAASNIDLWKLFVPHINEATIKCKADILKVTTEELAELLRTTLATLLSYDLNQMESNFFPAYEDLLRRKNLFETKSIITGVLVTAPSTQWLDGTMSEFANIVSQFTVRDLQILYRWRDPQLFAIQNIPMSIFVSGCGSIALADSLFKLSEALFGFPSKLPSCDIAFLLSRSLNEVDTKFTVTSIDDQNVLDIFRNKSKKNSWFDVYPLLQLKIDEGIWIETPRISQVATFSSQTTSVMKESSIPQVVSYIRNLNQSGVLNTIMAANYPSFLTALLNTYGYSAAQLSLSGNITESQLNSLTIQQAHSLILNSIMTRYNISDRLVDAVGIPGVDFHILTNLPSFEWDRIVSAGIQAAFSQSANAFSVKLNEGDVQITTVNGGFTSIQVSYSPTYHTNRITPSELANCLGRSLSSIYSLSFTEYHQLFSNNIVSILRNKLKFETQSMESLLLANGLQFEDIESKTVAEVITQLTGLTKENLGCFYPWNSTFLNTDLAKTFDKANTTRLCNDFLGLSLYSIVMKIQQTTDKVCFLCTIKPCHTFATCKDIPNAFTCTCKQGYTGNGISTSGCTDILECQLGLHNCHSNATCQDTSGSFNCTCKTGFQGDGELCADIKECQLDPNRCGSNGICVNTIGSFYCTCATGYKWNGTTCVDINECTLNTDNNCHQHAACTNTIGSFTCECNPGFTGNGVQCDDILECNFKAGLYPCHARANCFELLGTFRCECMSGYTGGGKDCTDINECNSGTDNCHTNALCFNNLGSFVCQCKPGFTGNGVTCSNINECGQGLDNCHQNADCTDNTGSFTCKCKKGFNGNGTYCYVAQVSFAKSSYAVIEGDNVEVTVSLSGAIDEISVVTIIIGGTATKTDNEDYTLSSEALLFQVNGPTTQTLTITTTNDTKLEQTETITLSLSPTQNHVVAGGIPKTTVSIVDNDVVTVTFSQSTYNVQENDGFASILVQIVSGTVDKDIIVSLNTVAYTATKNVDYNSTSEQIRFARGETAKIVKIPIRDDPYTEYNEQFNVSLSTSDIDVNILRKTAAVFIEDNDAAKVKFEKSTYSVDEEKGIVTVTVVLNGNLAVPVTARLSTTNRVAVSEKDYIGLINHDITFTPSGPTSVPVAIQILPDDIFENDENFDVSLSSRSSPTLVVINPTNAVITIVDNDDLYVSFVPSTYSVEEEATNVTVTVVISETFEKSLVLSLSTVDNTAKSGDGDYQALVASSLIFNVGDPNQKNISVLVLEDVKIEATETFYLDMTSSNPKILFPSGKRATINILNDDRAIAYIPNPSYSFQEDSSPNSIPVVVTGSLAIPVTVRLSTVHNTAVWPQDFTLFTNRELVFEPGQPQSKQLQLDIEDDPIVEAIEMFYVVLTTLDSHVTIGQWNKTKIQILDNDKLRVRFSSPYYSVREESGYAVVGLVLQDVLETTAMVTLTPSNGTATEPDDFPLRTYDVTLYPGQPRTVYVNITITNDMREEYSENFLVSLTPISSYVEIVSPSVTNITIAESDDVNFCDPNARQYPCHIKADCVDVPGSFVCTCTAGYTGDGLTCDDNDECAVLTCPFNGTCFNTPGSYKCVCKTGFVSDGVNCNDIDECADKKDDCDIKATCANTIGSFDCKCISGYEENGTVCRDIDECAIDTDNCHINATCANNPGSFNCNCTPGYRGSGEQCQDIDECIEKTDNCHLQATCANTQGTFVCKCNFGFTGDGVDCTDIDECTDKTDDCHVNALCSNSPPGSFSCDCRGGFRGGGRSCTDIDECAEKSDGCPANSNCRNTAGNFVCDCKAGFIHIGSDCQDIDECDNGKNDCDPNANCLNIPATFQCVCKTGYTGNGTNGTCTNLNECSSNPNSCHQYARCVDTIGSFNCTCNGGFRGNGTYCEDIIDCILLPRQYPCDIRAACTDVPGGFTCTCPSGFSLAADKSNCIDINECSGSYSCHTNATCVNIPGSYTCQCIENFVGDGKINCVDTTCKNGNPCSLDATCTVNVTTNSFVCDCHNGFTGNGTVCTDINECLSPGSCGANTDCVNLPRGSHTCSCKPGFNGNPVVNCVDIDECSNNPCHAQAYCDNVLGSHTCTCNPGFSGDGLDCKDIDECVSNPCHMYANCSNVPGNFTCTCNTGFTGNGKSCADVNECDPPSSCPANSECKNTPGTFSCTCKTGFIRNGTLCTDINECETQVCDTNANCINNEGSFQCLCPENLYNNGNFCHVRCPFKLDLAFIVDTSQSIKAEDFDRVRTFMTDSVAQMEIGENGNHIAAMAFGNTAEVVMHFNTITGPSLSRTSVNNILSKFKQLGGLTRIDLALLTAQTEVFTVADGMRSSHDIRKVAVVITDGKQTTAPNVPIEPLADIAKKLQAKNITVLAIGIGTDFSKKQLLNITNGIDGNVIEVNSFQDLKSVIFQFINISCTDIDECELNNPCDVNANCKDTLGAFSCLCNVGYDGNGYQCADVDECDSGNQCDSNAKCDNNVGSYNCTCKDGFKGNGRQCQDIDECNNGANNCDSSANCKNLPGTFKCTCKDGFSGDGQTCSDIDECDNGNNDCDSNANCLNKPAGTFSCACKSGYTGTGKFCSDIKECQTNNGGCHANADCANELGSRKCTCKNGFSGDGINCTDIDECQINNGGCNVMNASCVNIMGSRTCTCKKGFDGNGITCTVIGSCGGKTCHFDARCDNENCICKIGFTGDGTSCNDINECQTNNGGCHANAACGNEMGSRTCTCKNGFSGSGITCTDINECQTNNGGCHVNASCGNEMGSRTCTCKNGFSGDGETCTAMASCGGETCDSNARCVSNNCDCNTGFSGDGTICTDINECQTNNGGCHVNASCANVMGSRTCTCKNGFSENGITCTDINECQINNGDCHVNASCTNKMGSHTCTCKNGFYGNGETCNVINTCKDDSCFSNAECVSGMCVCKTWFTGNETNCTNSLVYSGSIVILEGLSNTADDDKRKLENLFKSYFMGNSLTKDDVLAVPITGFSTVSGGTQVNFKIYLRMTLKAEQITTEQLRNITLSNVEKRVTTGEYTEKSYLKGENYVVARKSASSAVGVNLVIGDISECLQVPSLCGTDQMCRNYPGTYECFCTNPGKFLYKGNCIDVSNIDAQIKVFNEVFVSKMSDVSSMEFFSFSRRLQEKLNEFFNAIYGTRYLGSTILNLSDGSVDVNFIIHLIPSFKPTATTLNNDFRKYLSNLFPEYNISITKEPFKDYNECHPSTAVHIKDCVTNSYCVNKYGTYDCECSSGYKKDSRLDNACIEEDDEWWIVYVIIFGAVFFVVLFLICMFCFLEGRNRNQERYTLHDEETKDGKVRHDERIDGEVAPGFPSSIPRSTSGTGSQILLGSQRGSHHGSERLAMYEVNPIYDTTHDQGL